MKKGRTTVKASVTYEAKRLLDEAADKLGMKHQEFFGRLLEWFTEQDEMVQLIAVKQIPESHVDDIVTLLYRQRCEEKLIALGEKALDAALKRQVQELVTVEQLDAALERAVKGMEKARGSHRRTGT